MQQVPQDTLTGFDRRLEEAQVPPGQRHDYHKWLRFYLDFCQKHGYVPRLPTSLGPFLNKLLAKNQSVAQRTQAAAAVRLFLKTSPEPRAAGPHPQAKKPPLPALIIPILPLPPLATTSKHSRPSWTPISDF